MGKKLIMVACGAGTYTSLLAAQQIKEELKKKKIENVEVKYGRIDEIDRLQEQINILVTTMNFKKKYDFPIINGISFVTGDEETQKKIISEIIEDLKN